MLPVSNERKQMRNCKIKTRDKISFLAAKQIHVLLSSEDGKPLKHADCHVTRDFPNALTREFNAQFDPT